jgi:hypothetical protein
MNTADVDDAGDEWADFDGALLQMRKDDLADLDQQFEDIQEWAEERGVCIPSLSRALRKVRRFVLMEACFASEDHYRAMDAAATSATILLLNHLRKGVSQNPK